MKETNKILTSLLLCLLPTMVLAKTENVYNTYNIYNEYHRFSEPDTIQEINLEQDNIDIPETDKTKSRFFISLYAPLVQHQNTKITDNVHHSNTTISSTNTNYKIFDNSALAFGIDNSDFRLEIDVMYADTETTNTTNTNVSETAFGLMADIPFLEKNITSPFVRIGMRYIKWRIEQTNYNITTTAQGLGYYFGLGLTHNFTKDIFGTISATYGFVPSINFSDIDADGNINLFSTGISIGYKF